MPMDMMMTRISTGGREKRVETKRKQKIKWIIAIKKKPAFNMIQYNIYIYRYYYNNAMP